MLTRLMLAALLFRGLKLQITGYGDTKVAYGADARYRCKLADPTGVLQVTWQRLFRDESIENLATYSKHFGKHVNEPYRGKVLLMEASLGSTSITLANATWGDESCYICSFNAYPDGSKRKQTCLTVEGISEVATDAQEVPLDGHEEDDAAEVVFSCSATGKPAPTVDWESAGSGQAQTVEVANSDGTFTSSSNLTLRVPSDWTGHVDCVLNSGTVGKRRERIPFSLKKKKKKDETGKALTHPRVALVVCTVLIITCIIATVAAAATLRWRRLKDTSRNAPQEKCGCKHSLSTPVLDAEV